ncbi:MAG: amino acid adenylation domain-containing protein [Pyrinomonadaceae bacterium]
MPLRSLFETPTIAGLAAQVDMQLKSGHGLEAPALVKASREGVLPLSFAQQRLWFLDQLEPDSTSYNIPAAVRLTGQLNVDALERSISEIIRRHEVLRTSFTVIDGQPRQVISPAEPFSLPVIDFAHLAEAEREAEARALAIKESQRPLDLSRGPLLRVSLLRLADDEHVLLVTMHHIISDGWSLGIFTREVGLLYEAYSRGEESPLEELSIQYADYAVWQREWLQGDVLDQQLDYWKQQLAGAPQVLELPTDHPRPPVQSYKGASQRFQLSEELSGELKRLSQQQGVTLFMTLLAAFQTLLMRYSGQQDVVVGADVANRNRAETEQLIGFFVNMMVLRTDLSGDPSFEELIGRVKEVALEGYEHQEVPFEKIVEAIAPEREMSRTPLFQVAFVLQNVPQVAFDAQGLTLSPLGSDSETAKFDLTLSMTETEGGITGAFEYSTDLFERSTIERMAAHLACLLDGVVKQPGQRLSELPLLTKQEEQQVLGAWNETASDYPRESCIHQLFEQQVERTPDAIAASFDDAQISYGELNSRANQLAHHLMSLGIGPDVLVGLMVERSIEMVVAVLGILKAGGAYLPLDSAYPLERLSFMLEDAGTPVLLTQEPYLDVLPAHWGQLICLDSDWDSIAQESSENPSNSATPDNLAYVIYTSGSTGRPKGVAVTHRAVNRLVINTNYVCLTPADVIAQASNSSFDAATFEIWGALLNGARLVGIKKEVALSPRDFADWIAAKEISTLFLTTALFNQIVNEVPKAFEKVRNLLTGGEQSDPKQFHEVLKSGPPERLLHVYGPTETTTYASWHEVKEVGAGAGAVPIGGPIANTEIYLLDAHLRLVPVGVGGQLYIGGDGLARGYLNRPELTAEKFIPHPYSTRPGERLYGTGDMARYGVDGQIEFLGRIDHQVKIRGFRIELGEIEAALNTHLKVRECVVVTYQAETTSDRRLAAYIVTEQEEAVTGIELRSYLLERLPEYMLPTSYVHLERMPLTPNGKVDRPALPAPEQAHADTLSGATAPRTPTEEIVAGIFCEVLGLPHVGIHDDFFELGGHSLLATQVVSRLRHAFAIELMLRALFETPSVAGLAQTLEQTMSRERGMLAPPIRAREEDAELALSFAQQRLWFLDQLEPNSGFYNIPAAVRLTGQLDVDALEQSISEIIRRHEVLRTSFTVVDGQPRQVISPAEPFSLPVIDFAHLAETEREAEARTLAITESQRPFDLSQGPLLRASLLRLATEEHVLLVTMHHIISDGWSIGVLIHEMSALYEAYSRGEESPLEELAIQYADYAVWQREWLQGDVLDQQLDYWKQQLAGAPQVLELPTDHPRPPVQSYKGASQRFQLSEELSGELKRLSQQQGVTLYMLMLAAFQTLLSRYSKQDDIVVGLPIAGRNRLETEPLIGFFVNALVLRTQLSGNQSFVELLGRVRDVTLEAYAHQDIPLDKLVEELQPERNASHTPLFQVTFGLQNAPQEASELPGLTLSPLSLDDETVRFDLTVWVTDEPTGLRLLWSYRTDLFEEATIKRMQGNFEVLLNSVIAQPEAQLDLLNILTEDEREERMKKERTREESKYKKLVNVKPKAIKTSLV